MRIVEAGWVRLALALTALVPLLVLRTPAFSRSVDWLWVLCAMYLWPATAAAGLVGIVPLGWGWHLIAVLYCSALAFLIGRIARRLPGLREQVSWRRALVAVSIVWLPIAAFLGYRVLEYKGLLTRPTACPGSFAVLAEHCGDITDLHQYELGGFLDRWYLARFNTRPGALTAIATRRGLVEVPVATIPRSVWAQPPVWWRPPIDATTRVYSTPAFPYEGRGGDGEHYLFVEHGQASRVYVMFKANF
jgi:hypothetical protein